MKFIVHRRKLEIACSFCLWTIACIIIFTNAGIGILPFLGAIYFVIAWIVVWLIRVVISVHRKSITEGSSQKMFWAAEPIVIIFGLLFAHFPGSYVRVILSLSEMTEYVEDVRNGRVDLNFEWHHPPTSVGLYTTSLTELLEDNTVRFITSDNVVMSKAGFAHSENGKPMIRGEDSYTHIIGGWWYWHQSW